MSSKTLYAILKLKENCTSDDIKKAWTAIKKVCTSNAPQYQAAKKAYDTLIDPVKREIYDNFQVYDDVQDPIQNSCMFSSTFLEDRDVEAVVGKLKLSHHNQTAVFVSLNDLYLGRKVDVKIKSTKPCNQCQNFVDVRPCPECSMLLGPKLPLCRTCNNTKRVITPILCKNCNGTRFMFVDSKTEVIVKPGMSVGQRLRCTNSTTEVIIKQIPHSIFSRQGNDLYMKKKISLAQALCGIRFVFEHLDKRKLLVTSPAGNVLSPGCRKIISKEGMPILNSAEGRRGDLIIVFQVNIPTTIEKNTALEIEELLPKRPEFQMPSNPETEEYNLTDFDPLFKLNNGFRPDEAYYDDKPNNSNPLLHPKNQCTHQ